MNLIAEFWLELQKIYTRRITEKDLNVWGKSSVQKWEGGVSIAFHYWQKNKILIFWSTAGNHVSAIAIVFNLGTHIVVCNTNLHAQ